MVSIDVTVENDDAIVDFGTHGVTLGTGDEVEIKMKFLNDQQGDHSLRCQILENNNEVATDTVNFSI
ncbi:MAG: hypothetical protein V3U72_04360 [Candidatus Aenigmarchaeota archaeon]